MPKHRPDIAERNRYKQRIRDLEQRIRGLEYALGESCRNSDLEYALQRAEKAEQRSTELDALAHVPGLWRCGKCELKLVASVLHAPTGTIGANTKPQQCANGCGPMWRVTERQAGNGLVDAQEALLSRAEAAEKRLAEVEAERKQERADAAKGEGVRWHCHDCIIGIQRPRCENCPDECDVDGCGEPGCAERGEIGGDRG
jgi:hypothetical protein